MTKNLIKIQIKTWDGFRSDHIPQGKKSGRNIFSVFQNMNQKSALIRMDDPVFGYTGFLVDLILVLQLLAVVAGRKDFYDQVRSTDTSQVIQLLRITDHAKIRLHDGVDVFIL